MRLNRYYWLSQLFINLKIKSQCINFYSIQFIVLPIFFKTSQLKCNWISYLKIKDLWYDFKFRSMKLNFDFYIVFMMLSSMNKFNDKFWHKLKIYQITPNYLFVSVYINFLIQKDIKIISKIIHYASITPKLGCLWA